MGFPVLGAIGVGVSLLEGALGAKDARNTARATVESIDKEMALLAERESKLRSAFTARRGIIRDAFGNRVNSLIDAVGNTLEDINLEFQSGQRQTGLAFSGSLQRSADTQRERAGRQFGFRQESLFDQLQTSIVETDVEESQQLAGIQERKSQLEGERAVAAQATNRKFLGIF